VLGSIHSPYPTGIVSPMADAEIYDARDDAATRAAGAALAGRLDVGSVVFLYGPLGAGKTTLVRGLVQALGVTDPVRSPTFNLIQTFETQPPVMHADLYRVASHQGIGLEEYLDSHICMIEWPERAVGLVPESSAWHVHIAFEEGGRRIMIEPPLGSSLS